MKQHRAAALAACVGHTLEWYDFSVYAFVATNIARAVFPAGHEHAAILATLAAFGVGFLARPLGGVVLGAFADRYGSKRALVLSFALMGFATVGLGLAPTYSQVGMVAPLVVTLLRLVQGLSAGGEFGVSVSYVMSCAPAGRRGLFGSSVHVGSALGALLGALLGFAVSTTLEPASMASWGWRLPFLAGAVVLIFGLYIRRRAPDAIEPPSRRQEVVGADAREASNLSRALRLFLFGGAWAIPFYLVIFYLPTFAQTQLHLSQRAALLASSIGLVAYVGTVPLAGWLSDILGRRKTVLLGCLTCLAACYPAFVWMTATPSFGTYLGGQVLLDMSFVCISGPAPALLLEMFPPRRLTWVNSAYALALAVFGGFTPMATAAAVSAIGVPAGPAGFLVAAALICGLVALVSPETAEEHVRRQGLSTTALDPPRCG